MKPLNILYVVLGYKPAFRIGGPITSVAAAAESLVKAGHNVTVYTTNSDLNQLLDVPTNQRINVNGVGVYYFTFTEPLKQWLPWLDYTSRANNYLYSPPMKAQMGRDIDGFDLVHTHLPFVWPTKMAGSAAIRAGVPLFYHQRGVFDPERLKFRSLKKKLYLRHVELPILRRANTLFALTEAEIESYRLLGLDRPTVVVPNGIDADAFSAPPTQRVLDEMGITAGDQVILFMSRIHPTKGADRLLNAFSDIAQEFPRARLVLAGPDDFRLKDELERLVAERRLQDRVLMPGMVTGDIKRSLLARADLFALLSDAEGFSIAILEALASSTAVMISPGCHFDAVESAGAGIVVGLEPAQIATCMRNLMANPQRLTEMGRNARQLVKRDYAWPEIVRRTEDIYREGLARATKFA